MQDILDGSWVFQQLVNQGLEKGKREGKKEEFLQFVEVRFPALLAQAKQVVERQMSVEQIRAIINKVYRANTIEEAGSVLQAHEEEQ